MKTISLEISKRLAPYLKNINTNKYYALLKWKKRSYYISSLWIFNKEIWDIKTLTLEEAIDFIKNFSTQITFWFNDKFTNWLFNYIFLKLNNWTNVRINYKWNIIIWIEKMLEYLLDNNLITN